MKRLLLIVLPLLLFLGCEKNQQKDSILLKSIKEKKMKVSIKSSIDEDSNLYKEILIDSQPIETGSKIIEKSSLDTLCEPLFYKYFKSTDWNQQIDTSAISPNGKYSLTVKDNGSVELVELFSDNKSVIYPPVIYDCGSLGCTTPERRVLFTPDGKYAITTSSFLGGPTIIWDTNGWIDISKHIMDQYGGIQGGFFALSPDGQYLAILDLGWKFGLSLSIIDFSRKRYKMVAGSMYTGNDYPDNAYIETVSALINKSSGWLDDLFDREDYFFSFSYDNKYLIVRHEPTSNYYYYDIGKHRLISCDFHDLLETKFDSKK